MKDKSNLKLWGYFCNKCNNQSDIVERCYEKPFDIKLCSKCGNTMEPKEVKICLDNIQKRTIKIKL